MTLASFETSPAYWFMNCATTIWHDRIRPQGEGKIAYKGRASGTRYWIK